MLALMVAATAAAVRARQVTGGVEVKTIDLVAFLQTLTGAPLPDDVVRPPDVPPPSPF